jgi:hypothetical protein
MRLKDTAPPPAGYFIRPSPDGPERGPLSLENLRDLAEFQHVTPEFWIRRDGETEPRPLRDLPDLMAHIFPEKKAFHFKSYQQTEDVDAGYNPVDVKNLFRCETSAPPIPRPGAPSGQRPINPPPSGGTAETDPEGPGLGLARREQPPPAVGFDPKAVLQASQAMTRARTQTEGNPQPPKPRFSPRRTFFWIRWSLAALLAGSAVWIWSDLERFQDIFLLMLLGMVPMVGAILLTVSDIIDWFLNRVGSTEIEPPDFTRAEAAFAAGEWRAAASEYLRSLQRHPLELHGYIPGIAAAVAAEEPKKAAALHLLANKNLGRHDRNLLTAALRRQGLPPLPDTPSEP